MPAYKGVWHGHHGGTGADTIWSPRLSPIQRCILHGKSAMGLSRETAISSCVLLNRHGLSSNWAAR
jgi:hypothetical protein